MAGQSYAGCCSVDPCNLPGFCPARNEEGSGPVLTTQTMNIIPAPSVDSIAGGGGQPAGMTTVYVTTAPTVSLATSPNAALGPATATDTVSAVPAAPAMSTGGGNGGGPFPVAATVGVAVGAFTIAALAAVCIWGRWRRKNKLAALKSEKGSRRGSPDSSKGSRSRARTAPALRPIIPSSATTRPFDVFGGMRTSRYWPIAILFGRSVFTTANSTSTGRYFGPESPDFEDSNRNSRYWYNRSSQFSTGDSTLVSPITPGGMYMDAPAWPELDSRPFRSELDSTPVTPGPSSTLADVGLPKEEDGRSTTKMGLPPNPAWNRGAYGTPPLAQGPIERPRATLQATAYERRSKTYANSWTKFQDVQV